MTLEHFKLPRDDWYDTVSTDPETGEIIGRLYKEALIENKIDVTICVGKLSKYTYEKLITNNKETYYFKNNNELINNLNSILKEKDTILIKGSHLMKLIEVVDFLRK